MNHRAFGLAASLAVLVLAACASSTTAINPSNTPSAQASSSPSAQASASATALDPCQVVTQSEASQLAGTTYAAGMLDTTTAGSQICWYGFQTTNVFEVIVAQAPDAATAQSMWDQEKGKVQSSLQKSINSGTTLNLNVNDTSITGADRAATGSFSYSGNGHTIAGSAVYLLKGAVFVAFANLAADHAVATASALETEAQIALGRVP
jgi:hypothetical protein